MVCSLVVDVCSTLRAVAASFCPLLPEFGRPQRAASHHVRAFPSGRADGLPAGFRGEVVDVNLAVEVLGLMLQAAREVLAEEACRRFHARIQDVADAGPARRPP